LYTTGVISDVVVCDLFVFVYYQYETQSGPDLVAGTAFVNE